MRFLAVALLACTAPPALAQGGVIGHIDFYGVRTLSLVAVREALGVKEGDSVTSGILARGTRLEALPGVEHAAIDAVCCEQGKTTLYVGVEETGSPALTFEPPPTGAVLLPEAIIQTYREFERAFEGAIHAGDLAEDDSPGHALMHFPAARAAQERFVDLASHHRAGLTMVLHQSANREHRAIAAQVLAYSPGKKLIVEDLVRATRDSWSPVRNNAVRALALFAGFAHRHPEIGIVVPAEPMVDLLNSLAWTDRNKASLALMQLTESRDSALLAVIKSRALPSLIEMARWKSLGHATPPLVILGRIAGIADQEIFSALAGNHRDRILEAAGR